MAGPLDDLVALEASKHEADRMTGKYDADNRQLEAVFRHP